MKAIVLILMVGVAYGQVPLHERDSAQTRFLVACSGKTVDEIDQLGDLRNFEDVASFLAARRQFADQCLRYYLEHQDAAPPEITIKDGHSIEVLVSKIPALSLIPNELIVVGIDLQDDERDGFKLMHEKNLVDRGFPREELQVLHAMTDKPNDRKSYLKRRKPELLAQKNAFLKNVSSPIGKKETRAYLEMVQKWKQDMHEAWFMKVLAELTPKARYVLVSYLVEFSQTGEGFHYYNALVFSDEMIVGESEFLNKDLARLKGGVQ